MTRITKEDLLRYAYGETSKQKSDIIKEALKQDFALRESLAEIQSIQEKLDTEITTPSLDVIERIMDYAAHKQKKLEIN
ncbi:MAG: hypothetical protein J5I50_07315 [Chitinophagaceae bacterium]|nr:hypothetical protein [Chitinophagaceae bacterium]